MAKVIVYSSAHCHYCIMAKQLLDRKNIAYTEIRVDLDPEKHQEMINKSRQRTIPQIFIDNQFIGGYTDLVAINKSRRLDEILAYSKINL